MLGGGSFTFDLAILFLVNWLLICFSIFRLLHLKVLILSSKKPLKTEITIKTCTCLIFIINLQLWYFLFVFSFFSFVSFIVYFHFIFISFQFYFHLYQYLFLFIFHSYLVSIAIFISFQFPLFYCCFISIMAYNLVPHLHVYLILIIRRLLSV